MQWFWVIALLFSLSACAHIRALQGPDTVPVILEPPHQPTSLQKAELAYGSEAPFTPVVKPAVVWRVWVTPHRNAYGDLLGGYWWYILESDWAFAAPQVPLLRDRATGYGDQPLAPIAPPESRPGTPSTSPDPAASNTDAIQKWREKAHSVASPAATKLQRPLRGALQPMQSGSGGALP